MIVGAKIGRAELDPPFLFSTPPIFFYCSLFLLSYTFLFYTIPLYVYHLLPIYSWPTLYSYIPIFIFIFTSIHVICTPTRSVGGVGRLASSQWYSTSNLLTWKHDFYYSQYHQYRSIVSGETTLAKAATTATVSSLRKRWKSFNHHNTLSTILHEATLAKDSWTPFYRTKVFQWIHSI